MGLLLHHTSAVLLLTDSHLGVAGLEDGLLDQLDDLDGIVPGNNRA